MISLLLSEQNKRPSEQRFPLSTYDGHISIGYNIHISPSVTLILLLCGCVESNLGPVQKSIKIVPNNVCSLKPKLHIISDEFAGYMYDIKAISETHLDDSINNLDLSKKLFHEPIRIDRNKFGGGVALYVSTKLNDVDRKDLCNTNWEIWSEIHSENKTSIVGVICRPSRSYSRYLEVFSSCIENIIDTQLQLFSCFY